MESAKKYRTSVEIEEDEERIEGLLVQGYSVTAISRHLSLSESIVYRAKRSIEERWVQVKNENRAKILGRLISNQLNVQRCAYMGWERSLRSEVTESDESGTVYYEGVPHENSKQKTTTKTQSGNPAFLSVIQRSDSMIAKWMGMEEDKDQKAGGLSPDFAATLRSQLGITAEDFQVLRQSRLQREAEHARALDVESREMDE